MGESLEGLSSLSLRGGGELGPGRFYREAVIIKQRLNNFQFDSDAINVLNWTDNSSASLKKKKKGF